MTTPTTPTTPRPMRIALCTFAFPKGFGPYGAQLRMLAYHLVRRSHWILWITWGGDTGGLLVPNQPDVGMSWLGGQIPENSPVYVSEINAIMRAHRIDALITMNDLTRQFVDEPFEPRSVAWFPNHFPELDPHSAHALHAYDAVASLAPGDASRVAAQLPYKEVRWVPHGIDVARGRRSKAQLRAEHGAPADAFVVAVTFANYDGENRKNVDLACLAFRQMRDALRADNHTGERRTPFLYIRAVQINAAQKLIQQGKVKPLNVDAIAMGAGLRPAEVRIDTRELEYAQAVELTELADVLLHPSKTEGFGMPILEAQALGVPVVTNGWGAMLDYTYHGVAVPPLQPQWHSLGWVYTPNISGFVEALVQVEGGKLPDGQVEAAAAFVRDELAPDVVTARLEEMLTTPRRPLNAPKYALRRYGDEESHSRAEWQFEWTVVADPTQSPVPDAIMRRMPNATRPVVVFQTLENSNEKTPDEEAFDGGHFAARPIVAVKTSLLAQALEMGSGSLDRAILGLLGQAGQTEFGGVGAVRIPMHPRHPSLRATGGRMPGREV